MNIVPIEKVNLVEAVYTQLKELLVTATWQEGTKIPSENELCRRFSVSRVVVREALQKLRTEGLIVTRQGVGTYAANPSNFVPTVQQIVLSESAYQDFLTFRQAVEITAVKLTRTRATAEDYDRMDACVQAMEDGQEDKDTYDLMDYNFHLALVTASHNEMLIRSMAANESSIISLFNAMNAVPDARNFGVASHRQIVANLRAGNIRQVVEDYNEMGRYNLARLERFFSK